MQNFLNHFLGTHDAAFHFAGLVFALLGTLLAKRHFWRKHKAQCEGVCSKPTFKLGKWLQENSIQIIVSLVLSFIVVRFIDVLLLWLNPKLQAAFSFSIPLTDDHIFYYLLTGVMVQLWIHKKYFKK